MNWKINLIMMLESSSHDPLKQKKGKKRGEEWRLAGGGGPKVRE